MTRASTKKDTTLEHTSTDGTLHALKVP